MPAPRRAPGAQAHPGDAPPAGRGGGTVAGPADGEDAGTAAAACCARRVAGQSGRPAPSTSTPKTSRPITPGPTAAPPVHRRAEQPADDRAERPPAVIAVHDRAPVAALDPHAVRVHGDVGDRIGRLGQQEREREPQPGAGDVDRQVRGRGQQLEGHARAGRAEAGHEPGGEQPGEEAAERSEAHGEPEGGVAQPDRVHELRIARQDRAEGGAVEEEDERDGPARMARIARDRGTQGSIG